MILGLSIALGVTIVAFLVLLDRKDKRATAAMSELVREQRLNVIALMDRQAREREDHRREIQILCNRLQAPQQAVMQSVVEQAGEERVEPLSDEEMAERELMLERIEQMEREGLPQ